MKSLEGPPALFLVEQAIATTVDPHELALCPSELAIERAKSLFDTVSNYELSHSAQHEGESDMQFFLRLQNLDFWDETISALHGDEEQYGTFLRNAVIRNPDHYFKCPAIFEEVVSDTEREKFIELYLISTENLRSHYPRLPDIATPSQLQHHADIILRYKKGTTYFGSTAILMAARYSSLPFSQRSAACENVITNSDWSRVKLDYPGNLAYHAGQPENGSVSFVQAYDEAVKTGLLDKEAIVQAFEKSRPDEEDREWQKAGHARNEALLKLKGVLPSTASPAEILTDMFRGSAEFSVSAYAVCQLVEKGLVSQHDVETASQVLNEQQRINLQKGLKYQQKYPRSKLQNEIEYSKHHDDERIKNLHREHCTEKKPIAENALVKLDEKYNLFLDVINYRGDLVDEQQELVWELLTQKDGCEAPIVNVTYNWDEIAPVMNDPERLTALVDTNIANGGRINYANWQEWKTYTTLSKDEIKNRFMKESSYDFLGNLLIDFRSQLDKGADLFTHQEIIEIVGSHINRFEIDDRDKDDVVLLCLRHLGKGLSRQLLDGLDNELPALEVFFDETRAAPSPESIDYYDLLDLIWESPCNSSLYVGNNFELVLDSCLERLASDHTIDVMPYFMRLMNSKQRAKLTGIILSNPACTELLLATSSHFYISDLLPDGREIASSAKPDLLAGVAPKSYKSLIRRLRAKQRSKQGRDHLLVNYAFHYDLASRLESFGGLQQSVVRLRGKNEEKNELRALELLTVLHESAGVTDFSQIENLSREDCETLATESIARSVAMDFDSSQTMVASLRTQGIDLVKFDMWMLNSFRSDKLKSYYGEFLKHTGNGGTLQTWKFETAGGNNLPDDVSGRVLETWRQDETIPVRLPDGQYEFRLSHDLKDIYLCGSRPSNNCLHYAYGENQRGLSALLSADSKMLTMFNGNGKPAGNAIIRIVNDSGATSLMLEPIYDAATDDFSKLEIHRAAIMAAEIHARQIGLPLLVGSIGGSVTTAAAQMIYQLRSKVNDVDYVSVSTLASKAPYTYTDSRGVGSKPAQVSVLRERVTAKAA